MRGGDWGRLLGTTEGDLVAFRTGDPQDDGWGMWGGGPGHNGTWLAAGTTFVLRTGVRET